MRLFEPQDFIKKGEDKWSYPYYFSEKDVNRILSMEEKARKCNIQDHEQRIKTEIKDLRKENRQYREIVERLKNRLKELQDRKASLDRKPWGVHKELSKDYEHRIQEFEEILGSTTTATETTKEATPNE